VSLLGRVVCKTRPSINAAYKKHAETLCITNKAVYNKINGLEPPSAAAIVRHAAVALAPVIEAMDRRRGRGSLSIA